MAMNVIWNWQSFHTKYMFRNSREVGEEELIVSV